MVFGEQLALGEGVASLTLLGQTLEVHPTEVFLIQNSPQNKTTSWVFSRDFSLEEAHKDRQHFEV